MRKHLFKSLGLAVVLGTAAYWYWSPYIALHDMRTALHKGDADAFNARVDFPKFRDSLKGQLAALLTRNLPATHDVDNAAVQAAANIGGPLGLVLINGMIDALVRPETLMQSMKSGQFKIQSDTQGTEKSKIMDARIDIATLHQALKLYKLDHGAYPTQAQGLYILDDPASQPDGKGSYIEKLPSDPWGRPYQYRNPGTGPDAVDVTHLPPPAAGSTASAGAGGNPPSWHTERKNADTMIIYAGPPGKPAGEKTGFVMERQGFAHWQISGIRLP